MKGFFVTAGVTFIAVTLGLGALVLAGGSTSASGPILTSWGPCSASEMTAQISTDEAFPVIGYSLKDDHGFGCELPQYPSDIELVDQQGHVLGTTYCKVLTRVCQGFDVQQGATSDLQYDIPWSSAVPAFGYFEWKNWCGASPGPLTLHIFIGTQAKPVIATSASNRFGTNTPPCASKSRPWRPSDSTVTDSFNFAQALWGTLGPPRCNGTPDPRCRPEG